MKRGASGTALVTGAGRRIGRAIAERLAREGYAVALHCNASRADAEAVAASILASGGRAAVTPADLEDAAALANLVSDAADALGPLTLLVNCASVFMPDTAEALEPATWDRQFAVNLRAPAFLSAAFAARLPDGDDGAIVNVIDQRVLRPTPQAFSYTLTKAALWAATRTMAQTFAPRIRVNAVAPGPTLVNPTEGAEAFEREIRHVPLRRSAPPADVAEAIVYLARAGTVTGQMIAIDSGQHLAWQTPDLGDFGR